MSVLAGGLGFQLHLVAGTAQHSTGRYLERHTKFLPTPDHKTTSRFTPCMPRPASSSQLSPVRPGSPPVHSFHPASPAGPHVGGGLTLQDSHRNPLTPSAAPRNCCRINRLHEPTMSVGAQPPREAPPKPDDVPDAGLRSLDHCKLAVARCRRWALETRGQLRRC